MAFRTRLSVAIALATLLVALAACPLIAQQTDAEARALRALAATRADLDKLKLAIKAQEKVIAELQARLDAYEKRAARPAHLRFALAGLIDINDDDKSDFERVKALIEHNGGVIDAVLDEQGKQTGEMSRETNYLVVGGARDKATQPETFAAYERFANRRRRTGAQARKHQESAPIQQRPQPRAAGKRRRLP